MGKAERAQQSDPERVRKLLTEYSPPEPQAGGDG